MKNEIPNYRRILKSARDLRQASDYNDFYLVTKEETQEAINNAEQFIKGVKEFIDTFSWEDSLKESEPNNSPEKG